MNNLKKQVQNAQRRLNVQRFLAVVFWFLLIALFVAAVGVLIPKIWVVNAEPMVWQWSWIGGSLFAGLMAAITYTVISRHDALDAAIELDKRFGLKERISSCLALNENEQMTDAGKALVNDAVRRVAEVNVKDEFKVAPNRWSWLPFAMGAIVFGLTFLSDAQPDNPKKAQASISSIKKIKNSTKTLKPKIAERNQLAKEKGLKEASKLFDKLERGLDSMAKKNELDKKDALLKLNDLGQEIKKRQKELGDPKQLRKQLNQLKDLKKGPADKLADALKNSDFKAAMNAIKELQKGMEGGKLSDQQKKQLQEQLAQMKQKLQEMVDAQQQAKQDLEQKIQQKIAEGDRQAATQLQKKLDKMNQQNQQMNQLQKLASKLGDCQQCMKQGNMQQAAQQLSDLAESLQNMQMEFDELEMLEGAMDQLAQAKDSMNCSSCNGQGCGMCQGMGMGQGGMPNQPGGRGMGEGQGRGARPESETKAGFYDSPVRANPGKGRAVIIGAAGGPNKPGEAIEEIKAEIETARSSTDDPLTGVRLPKPQRDLTKEYFESFRKGE